MFYIILNYCCNYYYYFGITQLQNEYSELLIEEKTLELKEKKEDKPEINPTL